LFYHYEKHAGFTVAVDGTSDNQILPFSWSKLVSRPTDIIFFAPPMDCLRPFGKLFVNQKTLSSCHSVFRQFALEYIGDVTQSSLLFSAYNRRMGQLRTDIMEKMPAKIKKDHMNSFKQTTLSQKVFVQMLDNNCRHSFMNSMLRWNKYETPIMLDQDFEAFMWAAEHRAFPDQWQVLEGIRGLNANEKRDQHRIGYKKRHVFFQILSLIRMSNFRLLAWWAMIQSTANYGWGVGSTASDINAYWGNTICSTSRNRRLAGMATNLTFHYRSLLTNSYLRQALLL